MSDPSPEQVKHAEAWLEDLDAHKQVISWIEVLARYAAEVAENWRAVADDLTVARDAARANCDRLRDERDDLARQLAEFQAQAVCGTCDGRRLVCPDDKDGGRAREAAAHAGVWFPCPDCAPPDPQLPLVEFVLEQAAVADVIQWVFKELEMPTCLSADNLAAAYLEEST